MLKAFINIFKIPDLRNKVLFTIAILVIYRIGFWIPLPGVDQNELKEHFEKATQTQTDGEGGGTAFGEVAKYISIFTGGNLGQSTLFGLGIMPYISAAIIFQLLATVLPSLEALKKEGPAGQQKIQEYTRYATVGLCVIQAGFWISYMQGQGLVYPQWSGGLMLWASGIVGLTAGTMFLMWLGEQIDKYGIGNGASLIITGGIISRMPGAIYTGVLQDFKFSATAEASIGVMDLLFLVASFVLVVAGCVLITQGQRRIPVQHPKHARGRKVYGGQQTYLPLRVNHGGVMPLIFASSLLILPVMGFRMWLGNAAAQVGSKDFGWFDQVGMFLGRQFTIGSYPYELVYIAMIYFFAFFWTSVQFQPREISIQLREHGSVIKGRSPGKRTADYLEQVMTRITYVGAGFLAIIAVIPNIVAGFLEIDLIVTSFLGGTALLISVSVCLDLVSRIDTSLQMRDYRGFLASDRGGRGPRIRGARG
jgi:preprotein translocase subunit SecY